MTKGMKKLKPFINIPVGEFIKDELEFRGWNQEDLAIIMGTSQKTINQIINGKQGITVNTAIKLGEIFGQSPEYWLNLYNSYCIVEAENANPKKSNTTELRKLYEKYPVSELKKKNWFPKTNDTSILTTFIKKYNLDNVPPIMVTRTGNLPNRDEVLRNTWINIAEYGAGKLKLNPYNREALTSIADQLPKYTLEDDGINKVITDLKNCGVGFLTLSHLPKTYLDGAVFDFKGNPIIVYTHRYDRTDNFWFTLAHEIAHIILHYKDTNFCILDNFDIKSETQIENEADEFANRILKNHEILNYMHQMKFKEIDLETKIEKCSQEIKICKSLVAGMFQFEFKSFYRNKTLNSMKKKVTDLIPEQNDLDKLLVREAELA